MKLYQKNFCYGSIVTSVLWGISLYLYAKMDKLNDSNFEVADVTFNKNHHSSKFKSKYAGEIVHNNDFDHEYGHNYNVNNDNRKVRNDNRGAFIEGVDEVELIKREKYKNEILAYPRVDDLSEMGIIRNADDQKIRDEGERLYAFNLLISDRLSLHRAIPDTRNELCKSHKFPRDLPSASVVICFHNEALSTLLRTVHSIIDKSPKDLLHEIILVDDFSDLANLKDTLEEYIHKKLLSTVKLHRTHGRQGLIRARMIGAEIATGEVLVFLDSHCEVNRDWLQPLLVSIHEDPRTVPIPVIDIINQDTFNYEASPLVRGGFNWGMHFRWDNIPPEYWKQHTIVDPIPTPTMAGGLFAIQREYFNVMGKYDSGLDIWGGENLEISFRIWQCGGQLEIVPCSRVGHIFRKRRPYSSPGGDAMLKNSLRVATVWLDEYKEYFLKIRPDARNLSFGDVTDRRELRKSLKCKSFKWFLDTVYPEQTLPDDKGFGGWPKGQVIKPQLPKTMKEGHLRHVNSKLCITAEGGVYNKRSLLKLSTCVDDDRKQVWQEVEGHVYKLADVLCLDVENAAMGELFPKLMKCHYSGGSQEWKWIGHFQKQLFNPSSGKCLGVEEGGGGPAVGSYLTMELCNDDNNRLNFELRGWLKR